MRCPARSKQMPHAKDTTSVLALARHSTPVHKRSTQHRDNGLELKFTAFNVPQRNTLANARSRLSCDNAGFIVRERNTPAAARSRLPVRYSARMATAHTRHQNSGPEHPAKRAHSHAQDTWASACTSRARLIPNCSQFPSELGHPRDSLVHASRINRFVLIVVVVRLSCLQIL